MPERDVVTDPDVLELYRERLWLGRHNPQAVLDHALISGTAALLTAARGWEYPAAVAQETLTELGERAAPLPDEGVPCG